MRINDAIFFSPQLLLKDLDLTDKGLVIKSFKERILGYYFEPIQVLLAAEQAFAAGALECLLIDAFARYSTPIDGVEARMVRWCEENLGVNNADATDFYKFFRCGLLHEGHIKNYGQFTFNQEFDRSIERKSNFIVVNPKPLFIALQKYLDVFITLLEHNAGLYQIFATRMRADFEDEVERAKSV
jgi:hypothetical protein